MFHVSLLNKFIGDSSTTATDPPAVDEEENDTWEDYSTLKGQFPTFDPWGQGSSRGVSIVVVGQEEGRGISEDKLGNKDRGLGIEDRDLGIESREGHEENLPHQLDPKTKKVATEGSDNDPNRVKSSISPFKGQIDLNIQPEREEELSPGSDSGSMMRLLQDATDIYLRQHSMLTSSSNSNLDVTQTQPGGGLGEVKDSSSLNLGTSHQHVDREPPTIFSTEVSAPTPTTG
ncbi:hypothetical protein F3Y22_tig00110156pilonHSYRG00171 [Hibiscus syriacus]|uniref:Uncharacterized protein n=1 Tax=Hibiscus syriacus TaxID=106335 RepID=A0A6A3BG13_HIBSY|nr:hypothetical protein F3Y22_tig00110156pilonHSYRG00171 [Hibiscus syriacus]